LGSSHELSQHKFNKFKTIKIKELLKLKPNHLVVILLRINKIFNPRQRRQKLVGGFPTCMFASERIATSNKVTEIVKYRPTEIEIKKN